MTQHSLRVIVMILEGVVKSVDLVIEEIKKEIK